MDYDFLVFSGEKANVEVLKDVDTVLTEVTPLLREDILSELTCVRNTKWHITCRIRFVKAVINDDSDVEKGMT